MHFVLRWLGRLLLALPVLALLAPVTAFFVTVWSRGWQLQVVESGSMAPYVPVGALVVVETVDASTVQPGSIVVFASAEHPGTTVTHRVVEREETADGPVFTTRGDANASNDANAVPASAVRGRVRFHVPGAGGVIRLLSARGAPFVLVGVPLVLLAASEIRGWLRRRADGRRHRPDPCLAIFLAFRPTFLPIPTTRRY